MDEYRKYEPIFGSWYLVRLLGKGSFGKVFEIAREEFGTTYRSALKIITVPQDDDDIKTRMSEGTDLASISEYYEGILKEIVNENEIMAQLRGNSNIVSYEDHQIIPHEDGIGYDILIRMELLTPLLDRMMERPLGEKEIVRLGIDMCKALEVCHRKNIIHRDIKPQNIFISENGDFKLGDFGIARTIEKTTGGMSKKGTYKYMAPEVFRGENYDSTVDIYSLGIVLYSLLNGSRGPFLPAPPTKVTHNDEEVARLRRFRGEPIPAPRDASPMLAYIIQKASSADPSRRYRTAEQMRRDLESYLNNYGVTPAVYYDSDRTVPDVARSLPANSGNGRSKATPLLAVCAILLVAVLGALIVIIANIGNNTNEATEADREITAETEDLTQDSEADNTDDRTDEAANDEYSAEEYVASSDSARHIFYFDTEGGQGDFEPLYVSYDEYFTIPSSVPKKEGYRFQGWYVERLVDGGWYSHESFSWVDWEDYISGKEILFIYEPGSQLLFDDSWEKNGGDGSNYVLHAVWN